MDKLKMHTPNKADQNWEKLVELFPNALTETIDENGQVVRAIDKDILMQEINTSVVEGREERYQFTWPGKKKAVLSANASSSNTLRPFKEDSVDFENTENLYIEGDNLDVLKLLQETYLNKIKLIYVDPPYNTGSDILYKNNYEMNESDFLSKNNDLDENGYVMSMNNDTNGRFHTDWINMMYPRLKIAKDLLADNGCIVVAIDHNELINVTKICDEIFSERNRVGIVSIIHKPEGRNQGKYFAASNEFALFYAKNIDSFEFNSVILDSEKIKEYQYSDAKGRYKLNSLITKNRGRQGYDKNLKENNPKNHYPIFVSEDLTDLSLQEKTGYISVYPNTKTQERTWRFIKESLQEKIEQDEILATKELDEIKIYEKYREDKGQLIKTHWIDTRYNYAVHGTGMLTELMGSGTFDFPKSLYLLEDIIKLTTFSDSIVLDFFSGSATTAHAVMLVNSQDGGSRKIISVQLNIDLEESLVSSKGESKNSIQNNIDFLNKLNRPRLLSEIGKERIRRAGNKIKEESPLTTQDLDIGFRVLKLDSSNMKDVYYSPDEYDVNLFDYLTNNIKEDRTGEDLLFQVMLDLGVLLSSKVEENVIADKIVFNVEDGYLIACFDEDVTDETIKAIAQMKPYYFVMRDSSLANDSVATNFEQIFATYSPDTIRKVI